MSGRNVSPSIPGTELESLGIAAADTLYDLCDVPDQACWAQSDLLALQNWLGIEGRSEPALEELREHPELRGEVNGLLFAFRTSLPFDEAEREWLSSLYWEAYGPNSTETIREQEAGIVSAGLYRVVRGDDLLSRWARWRRQEGEFRANATIDIARETLRALVETVAPDQELPESYISLRTDERSQREA